MTLPDQDPSVTISSVDADIITDLLSHFPTDWVGDIAEMHTKFGVNDIVGKLSPEMLKTYLKFRIDMMQEELDEVKKGFAEKDAEQVVDGIIDLCVFAVGTLDVFNVDGDEAWEKVFAANIVKKPGVKAERPNPYGLPDLIKPEGWVAPSHEGNHGLLPKALESE
jgi:predicted HAD superfamily Cof-like phosphohydrolase